MEYQSQGSRVSFKNDDTKHKLKIHKPHPHPYLKPYQVNEVIEGLKESGVINENDEL